MDKFTQFIDFTDNNLHLALLTIVAAPTIWNILGRMEFYTHILTKLACGNKYFGCYILAVYIFGFSALRDHFFFQAILSQPKFDLLGSPAVYGVGVFLAFIGQVFAITSLYQLGLTGTYLGDYFGILMKERVTAFPFNVLEHPMYHGATMTFLGMSLMNQSVAGIVLTAVALVMYTIAIAFEGPFTSNIYEQAAKEAKKQK
eukprot:gene6079-10087_t